jgi:hypothetical protein
MQAVRGGREAKLALVSLEFKSGGQQRLHLYDYDSRLSSVFAENFFACFLQGIGCDFVISGGVDRAAANLVSLFQK